MAEGHEPYWDAAIHAADEPGPRLGVSAAVSVTPSTTRRRTSASLPTEERKRIALLDLVVVVSGEVPVELGRGCLEIDHRPVEHWKHAAPARPRQGAVGVD